MGDDTALRARSQPRPLDAHAVPEFPVEVLPDWLQSFVAAEAEATQTPTDLPGMLGLAVVAAACAGVARCQVDESYSEPLNLFVLVALPPGNRKSRVFADMVRPVEDFEAEQAARLRDTIEGAEQQRRILAGRMNHVEAMAAKVRDEERAALQAQAEALRRELAGLPSLATPRRIVDECTPEKLASLLAEQDGRIALLSPEGDSLGLFAGRYSQRGAPNFGILLRGHAGDPVRVDRVGRPSEHIAAPALAIGMAAQPKVLAGLFAEREFVVRGLCARFLYAVPRSRIGQRRAAAEPVPAPVKMAYEDAIKALLGLAPAKGQLGCKISHRLALAPQAREALHAYHDELEPRLAEDGDLGHMSGWAGKLVGTLVRLAGLLHMADCAGLQESCSVPVPRETVERAKRLEHYLIPHALAAHGLMGADSSLTHARFVLERLVRMGAMVTTEREAFEVTKSRFRRVEELRPVLALLEDLGYLRRIPAPPRGGPGRPGSPRIELNPLCLAERATRAEDRSVTGHSANTGETAPRLPA